MKRVVPTHLLPFGGNDSWYIASCLQKNPPVDFSPSSFYFFNLFRPEG